MSQDAEHDRGRGARGIALDCAPAQQRARARQQVAQVDRLGDVVVARDFQPENAIDLGVAARHEDDPGLAECLDFLGELETVTVGKLHVEEDQVGAPALERLAALGAAPGFGDLEIMVGEIPRDHRARDRIVLDDDQPFAALCIARRCSGWLGQRQLCLRRTSLRQARRGSKTRAGTGMPAFVH